MCAKMFIACLQSSLAMKYETCQFRLFKEFGLVRDCSYKLLVPSLARWFSEEKTQQTSRLKYRYQHWTWRWNVTWMVLTAVIWSRSTQCRALPTSLLCITRELYVLYVIFWVSVFWVSCYVCYSKRDINVENSVDSRSHRRLSKGTVHVNAFDTDQSQSCYINYLAERVEGGEVKEVSDLQFENTAWWPCSSWILHIVNNAHRIPNKWPIEPIGFISGF